MGTGLQTLRPLRNAAHHDQVPPELLLEESGTTDRTVYYRLPSVYRVSSSEPAETSVS